MDTTVLSSIEDAILPFGFTHVSELLDIAQKKEICVPPPRSKVPSTRMELFPSPPSSTTLASPEKRRGDDAGNTTPPHDMQDLIRTTAPTPKNSSGPVAYPPPKPPPSQMSTTATRSPESAPMLESVGSSCNTSVNAKHIGHQPATTARSDIDESPSYWMQRAHALEGLVVAIASCLVSPGGSNNNSDALSAVESSAYFGGGGSRRVQQQQQQPTPSFQHLPSLHSGSNAGSGASVSHPSIAPPRLASAASGYFTTRYQRNNNLMVSTNFGSIYFSKPDIVETSNVVVGRDDDDNKTINNYVILGELGRGSYGKVKLAEHQHTKEIVAIKVIKVGSMKDKPKPQRKKSTTDGSSMKNKLLQEIAVMKKVAHENLVRLYEVMNDPEKEKIYLVMQYVPNGTIAVKGSESGTVVPIEPNLLRKYAYQISLGLRALHRNGVFHRDVKPDNILLGEGDKVFVADFGVSVICSEEGVEGVEGTPAFMAPELIKGDKTVSGEAVDAWAFGVTLYQLMYGVLPFNGETHLQLTRRIVNDDVEFPTDRDDVPPSFVMAVRRLLTKDPSQRLTLKEFSRCEWLFEDREARPPIQNRKTTAAPSSGTDEGLGQTTDDDAKAATAKHLDSSNSKNAAAAQSSKSTTSSEYELSMYEDLRGSISALDIDNAVSPTVVVETPAAAAKRLGGIRRKVLSTREASMRQRGAPQQQQLQHHQYHSIDGSDEFDALTTNSNTATPPLRSPTKPHPPVHLDEKGPSPRRAQ